MSDWFDDLLEAGAEIYKADKSLKMEKAKVQQAQILATVEKEQQPSATPTDAKMTAVMPGSNQVNGGFLPGVPRPYLYAGAGVAVVGLILLLRK